jgi:hypothetical protein
MKIFRLRNLFKRFQRVACIPYFVTAAADGETKKEIEDIAPD